MEHPVQFVLDMSPPPLVTHRGSLCHTSDFFSKSSQTMTFHFSVKDLQKEAAAFLLHQELHAICEGKSVAQM